MKATGFTRCLKDPCVYTKKNRSGDSVYHLLYVDDMLIAARSKKEISRLKEDLKSEFEMKDLGLAARIPRMNIIRDRKKGELKLTQGKYVKQILRTSGMEFCKPVVTPTNCQFKLKSLTDKECLTEAKLMEDFSYANVVGSLMYAMVR